MSIRIAAGASDLAKLWGAKLDAVGSCAFEAGLDIQLAAMETIVNIIMGHPLGYVESTRTTLPLVRPEMKDEIAFIPRPEASPLHEAVNAMMKSMNGASMAAFPTVYAFVSCYASPSWRKEYNTLSSFLNNAVTEAHERENATKGNDTLLATDADCVLDMIIQREAREGAEKFEKGEILDELMMYVFAGQETTASALRWLVKYLPNDPEIQHRLHEEICGTLGWDENTSEHPDFQLLDDSERMPVLEAVVAETLRCAGVGSLIGREREC
ncbi:Steroid 21-hydroxylase [Rhizoctonia solani AG-1 IB]|nr:Steroid 21-hydroxylase [Rhizoctonia solani AG-1 IB]